MRSQKPINNDTPRSPAPPIIRYQHPPNYPFACDLSKQPAGATSEMQRISPAVENNYSLLEQLDRCTKENHTLKNLLLVNLDLVKQQNDKIAGKDKAITSLKRENEAAVQRILKIEEAMVNLTPHELEIEDDELSLNALQQEIDTDTAQIQCPEMVYYPESINLDEFEFEMAQSSPACSKNDSNSDVQEEKRTN